MSPISGGKTLLASGISLILGAANAQASLVTNVLGPNTWSSDSANLTVLAPNGGVVGGTNDIAMAWDGNAYNASSDYAGPGAAANVTMSTTTGFFQVWTAHDIQMFVPGSYSFDVGDNTPGAATGGSGGANGESVGDMLNVTVPAGMLGMHMLFDWNGNLNIDIFVVFAQNSVFGSGLLYTTTLSSSYSFFRCDTQFTSTSSTMVQNCLYDAGNYGSAGAPVKDQVWMLASTDGNGDGVMGIPMASGGAFETYSFNFNANLTASPIPVPAAAWLFGSGLLGLIGVARHRKKN